MATKENQIIAELLKDASSDAVEKLIEVIRQSPQAPCADCRMYYYCAENEAACPDYKYYSETGHKIEKDRTPTHALYWRIFVRPKLKEI